MHGRLYSLQGLIPNPIHSRFFGLGEIGNIRVNFPQIFRQPVILTLKSRVYISFIQLLRIVHTHIPILHYSWTYFRKSELTVTFFSFIANRSSIRLISPFAAGAVGQVANDTWWLNTSSLPQIADIWWKNTSSQTQTPGR